MRRFGLIGRKLGHSFSAKYFAEKFEREGLSAECEYSLYELSEIGQVEDFVGSTPSLVVFNVTIPYKQQIIPYLTSLSDEARNIGAVNCNTIVFAAVVNLFATVNNVVVPIIQTAPNTTAGFITILWFVTFK